MNTGNDTLLQVNDLCVEFGLREGVVKAVDGMNFTVSRGRTLGIIGESGCGKSVAAKAIMNMVPRPGRITGGEVLYRPRTGSPGTVIDLTKLDPDGDEIRRIRGGEIAMIFQEPMSSLTPVYTAGYHIMEALRIHRPVSGSTVGERIAGKRTVGRAQAREIAIEMLKRVGIPNPQRSVDSYPHQLSGGQRQRVMIAIALSCEPALLIADEPTTALDVSVEAQILELMRSLQETTDTAIMFITHNLGVVAHMADEIVVMYMGKEVERAETSAIMGAPKHPYTQALLNSVPILGRRSRKRLAYIRGMVPSATELPSGCVFHPRCARFMAGECDRLEPGVTEVEKGHWVRCVLYQRSEKKADE